MHTIHRGRPGFLLLDAVFGLALMVLVIGMLASAAAYHRRGAKHFALERDLVHEAEHALSEMQQGRAAAGLHEESQLHVGWLPLEAGGVSWAEVHVERDGQSVTLRGWAPRPAEPEGGGR